MRPGGAYDQAVARSSWRDSLSGLPAAALGSAGPIYLGAKAISRKRSRSAPDYSDFDSSKSYGTYSGVVWRPGGAASWARGPKGWDTPDQPWPTAASGGGDSAPAGKQGKSHFNSKVRYTRD